MSTVVVVDGGARGHVLAEQYLKSPEVDRVVVVPGKGMMAENPQITVAEGASLTDPETIYEALPEDVMLVDVAQDDALATGTVDFLRSRGYRVLGPTRDAARLEWDKAWARNFMSRHGIPIPEFRAFRRDDLGSIKDYLREREGAFYVKASGLCGGKGALRAGNREEVFQRLDELKRFGEAASRVVIEEELKGEEFSFYVMIDRNYNYVTFKPARDYKRALDGDRGGQTGGMGSFAPVPFEKGTLERIEERLVKRALDGLRKEGMVYEGVLYIGGMLVDGEPYCIEFNARWGDPEAQVIVPGIEDYLKLARDCLNGGLHGAKEDGLSRVCVVVASKGYPADYSALRGEKLAIPPGSAKRYWAGVDGDGRIAGGRLVSFVGEGSTLEEARENAYRDATRFVRANRGLVFYRRDIAKEAGKNS